MQALLKCKLMQKNKVVAGRIRHQLLQI